MRSTLSRSGAHKRMKTRSWASLGLIYQASYHRILMGKLLLSFWECSIFGSYLPLKRDRFKRSSLFLLFHIKCNAKLCIFKSTTFSHSSLRLLNWYAMCHRGCYGGFSFYPNSIRARSNEWNQMFVYAGGRDCLWPLLSPFLELLRMSPHKFPSIYLESNMSFLHNYLLKCTTK